MMLLLEVIFGSAERRHSTLSEYTARDPVSVMSTPPAASADASASSPPPPPPLEQSTQPFGIQWTPATSLEDGWRPSTLAEREATTALHSELRLKVWRRHKYYKRTMAHHLVEEVHKMFRKMFHDCLAAYEKSKEVDVRRFAQCLRSLEGHHRGEDEMYFPMWAREHPEIQPFFDHLSLDHRHLHPLERRVLDNKDGEALREFVSFLDDHLNREEMATVSMWLATGPTTEGW